MATLVGRGFSYEPPRCVSGGVGGQFRPEGWHQVVGRVDRAGWRRGVGWTRGGSSPSSSALFQIPT